MMAKREVDFIRYLLDYIDTKIDQKIQNNQCEIEVTDHTSNSVESPIDDDKRFIPPLQANIEMMKKLSGVPPKDETLSQSQQQGGPIGGKVTTSNSDIVQVLSVLDGSMFSQ